MSTVSTFLENWRYEVKCIDHYLDGGSIAITTTDGIEFFIDNRIKTKTKGAVYVNHPESSQSRLAYGFEKDKLIEALVEFSMKKKEN